MQKLLNWLNNNLVEICVAVILILVPLYPKLPLVGINHTWVYIRLDDLIILFSVIFWLYKTRLRNIFHTPLSLPVLFYWGAGGVSLIFCFLFLRTHLANFFPTVAVLHYLRRIEYLIVFFIVFSTIKNTNIVKKYLLIMGAVLALVCFYGFGQRLLGFPAFLTMNEEFAKGQPLYLSATSRLTSTFAGHYDLAAYLVLMIGLFSSVFFALKNRLVKISVLLLLVASYILLLQTASRISLGVYLIVISLVLILQKQKKFIIPVFIVSFLLLNLVSGAAERFAKTFRVQRVVYDAQTGKAVGTVEDLPQGGQQVAQEEDLPLGTGFIDIPVNQENPAEATQVAYIKKSLPTSLKTASMSSQIATISGEFLIKRALVYDISFTTRFQGTWPRAWNSFKSSPIFGTGYSSIALASDNSYLRALGETGLVGLLSFLAVIFAFGLIIKQGYLKVKDKFGLSVIIGVGTGSLGVALNGILIDIFEASKVAYMLWSLVGMAVGLVVYFLPKRENLFKEFFAILKSKYLPPLVLLVIGFVLYLPEINNYFIGDDFTWLRWAAEADTSRLTDYFINSEGFFYRPLAKTLFAYCYPFFGLRPQGYHLVDIILHLLVCLGLYFVFLTATKKKSPAFIASCLFLINPINLESVGWISSTSALLASFFYVYGFLAFIFTRNIPRLAKPIFFCASIILFVLGLVSHELAITFPLLLLAYNYFLAREHFLKISTFVTYLPYLVIGGAYFYIRNIIASSHWMSGDYSYNFKNLIYNVPGNLVGYFGETIFGLSFHPVYITARDYFKSNKLAALLIIVCVVLVLWLLTRKANNFKTILKTGRGVVGFTFCWIVITLAPFLGLGNITQRYGYLASFGVLFLLILFLQQISSLILKNSRWKLVIFSLFLVLLSAFYLNNYRQVKRDWFEAGEIANNILLAISSNYSEFPDGSVLYFVNVPIKHKSAWVFPVGLKDGLWFIYPNINFTLERVDDISQALSLALPNLNAFVFNYREDLLVEETAKYRQSNLDL